MRDFDIVVIGGGSAGFAAAGRVAESGARTALVEGGALGGDCPNTACVPTKILLESANLLTAMKGASDYGVVADNIRLDFQKVRQRRQKLVDQLTGDRLRKILDQRGISLFTAKASFISNHEIELDGTRLTARKFILATGSKPAVPKIDGLSKGLYITSEEAVALPEPPGSVLIIGGGAVGVEFAQIFRGFGGDVTLVEEADRLLIHDDAEISELLLNYLSEQGIKVMVEARVERIRREGELKTAFIRTDNRETSVRVDTVLVATGRLPAVDQLNLAAAGVERGRSGVTIGRSLRTTARNIWACGDITGKLLYTHVAAYEGDLAGYNAAHDLADRADYRLVPKVTFADPEVASVGLTETEAADAVDAVAVGRMPYRYLGRALIDGERRGLIKLVIDNNTRLLLGGHIIGRNAGELIHEVAAAIGAGVTVDALAEMIHAYPTYAEGIGAAAAAFLETEGLVVDRAA